MKQKGRKYNLSMDEVKCVEMWQHFSMTIHCIKVGVRYKINIFWTGSEGLQIFHLISSANMDINLMGASTYMYAFTTIGNVV